MISFVLGFAGIDSILIIYFLAEIVSTIFTFFFARDFLAILFSFVLEFLDSTNLCVAPIGTIYTIAQTFQGSQIMKIIVLLSKCNLGFISLD